MFEIYNNLGKVQDTRKTQKTRKENKTTDMTRAWSMVNPDRINLIHAFGGSFRINTSKAA